uniref:Bm9270 n=1 Tax=Brugia malayi TaxID=6279 RepID=A0A0H5S4I9_BRUMA|nr:Bm9270 [Brugia malayi]
MYSVVTIIVLLTGQTNGQYGEIASLIGDSLTPGLFGSAASGLAGAASVYQIAQGALQLTGTDVGILNQAAEGKWFNKVVEEARNANREIQDTTLIGAYITSIFI